MTGDLTTWLRSQLDNDEQGARELHDRNCGHDGVTRSAACDCDWHVARVLAEVAAKRAILDEITGWRHEVVDGDCWYTCAAATEDRDGGETCDEGRQGSPCDCGLDARRDRLVRLLAAPYADRAGYLSEWRPQ